MLHLATTDLQGNVIVLLTCFKSTDSYWYNTTWDDAWHEGLTTNTVHYFPCYENEWMDIYKNEDIVVSIYNIRQMNESSQNRHHVKIQNYHRYILLLLCKIKKARGAWGVCLAVAPINLSPEWSIMMNHLLYLKSVTDMLFAIIEQTNIYSDCHMLNVPPTMIIVKGIESKN